ncbi:cytochrome P450 [Acrocarpospora sp. B8E8]|uniref:cytochrome P450 n=1 Tax=Acrocarpospora sp. B8E8 TaxID=3153572 RepID=UPI00325EB5F7
MSYLDRYERLLAKDPAQAVQAVAHWIGAEWRPFFAELREARPVLATPAFTLVTRFADVIEVLSREKVFTVRLYGEPMEAVLGGPYMLTQDATPLHWAERGLTQAVLPAHDVPRVRELAGRYADEALDMALPAGRIDAVEGLARYVLLRICGDYLGVPGPDPATLSEWSRASMHDIIRNLPRDPNVHATACAAGSALRAHVSELIAERRRTPGEDALSRLVSLVPPASLGFDELRLMVNGAGLPLGLVENAAQSIVQIIRHLLGREDGVREEAIAAARAGEPFDGYAWEALRFAPFNPLIFRFCERDHRLASGTLIKAGTPVFACTSSAGMDEEAVADPADFRTDRPDFVRLHFGYGPHDCVGKHVGVAVIPEVVRRVLRRPGVALLPGEPIDFDGGPFPRRFPISLGAS